MRIPQRGEVPGETLAQLTVPESTKAAIGGVKLIEALDPEGVKHLGSLYVDQAGHVVFREVNS